MTKQEAIEDFLDKNSKLERLACFCFNKLMSFNNIADFEKMKFDEIEGENPCIHWLETYIIDTYSAYMIAAAISLINMVQLEIFQNISAFEKNHFITTKLTSAMNKMFLV